jgi:hypothetical protein
VWGPIAEGVPKGRSRKIPPLRSGALHAKVGPQGYHNELPGRELWKSGPETAPSWGRSEAVAAEIPAGLVKRAGCAGSKSKRLG